MFTVMELNVANYVDHNGQNGALPGPWADRLPMIVEAIIAGSPDLIALSEIELATVMADPSDPADMAQQIFALLQAQSPHYAGACMVTNIGATYTPSIRWEALTIISRFPMTSGYILHSQGDGGNTRNSQWANVATPDDGTIWFYNTHFSLDPTSRYSNASQLLALIKSQTTTNICLVGDLNATPDDPALALLSEAGLVDIWALLQPGAPGYTFQSFAPVKRIDYCWASPDLSPAASAISLVGTQPSSSGYYLSDHCGTLTTFG